MSSNQYKECDIVKDFPNLARYFDLVVVHPDGKVDDNHFDIWLPPDMEEIAMMIGGSRSPNDMADYIVAFANHYQRTKDDYGFVPERLKESAQVIGQTVDFHNALLYARWRFYDVTGQLTDEKKRELVQDAVNYGELHDVNLSYLRSQVNSDEMLALVEQAQKESWPRTGTRSFAPLEKQALLLHDRMLLDFIEKHHPEIAERIRDTDYYKAVRLGEGQLYERVIENIVGYRLGALEPDSMRLSNEFGTAYIRRKVASYQHQSQNIRMDWSSYDALLRLDDAVGSEKVPADWLEAIRQHTVRHEGWNKPKFLFFEGSADLLYKGSAVGFAVLQDDGFPLAIASTHETGAIRDVSHEAIVSHESFEAMDSIADSYINHRPENARLPAISGILTEGPLPMAACLLDSHRLSEEAAGLDGFFATGLGEIMTTFSHVLRLNQSDRGITAEDAKSKLPHMRTYYESTIKPITEALSDPSKHPEAQQLLGVLEKLNIYALERLSQSSLSHPSVRTYRAMLGIVNTHADRQERGMFNDAWLRRVIKHEKAPLQPDAIKAELPEKYHAMINNAVSVVDAAVERLNQLGIPIVSEHDLLEVTPLRLNPAEPLSKDNEKAIGNLRKHAGSMSFSQKQLRKKHPNIDFDAELAKAAAGSFAGRVDMSRGAGAQRTT